MNPVNKFIHGEQWSKHGELVPKHGGENRPKKVVVKSAHPMKQRIVKTNPVPKIPGVDILPEREEQSKRFAGPFYADQIEMLVAMARVFRDRAKQGVVFIAPDGIGFSIFKRKAVRA